MRWAAVRRCQRTVKPTERFGHDPRALLEHEERAMQVLLLRWFPLSITLGSLLAALAIAPPVGATSPETPDLEAELERQVLADDEGSSGGGSGGGGESSSGPLSKLTVHGYLTQAYAEAKFSEGGFANPTAEEIIFGIPEDGTFDYRTMAIQFRYEATPKDIMIVQLSSRSLGDSPINDTEDEIELDWAFYERRLTNYTSLKVGRVQIPLGIFNEIRDVGTVLPFYRPPFVIYREGSFTSETVDGLALAHTFNPDGAWSIDFDVYGGQYELLEANSFTPTDPPAIATAEDVIGFQLWLNSPFDGLRFGASGQVRDVTGGQEGLFRPFGKATRLETLQLSFDLNLEQFVGRVEYRIDDADPDEVFFGARFDAYYVQLGYHPAAVPKFRIYAQAEFLDVSQDSEDFIPPFGVPATRDLDTSLRQEYAVALNYFFSPSVVLKAEHHFDVDSDQLTLMPIFTPTGPALQPLVRTAEGGEYTIISLSASF